MVLKVKNKGGTQKFRYVTCTDEVDSYPHNLADEGGGTHGAIFMCYIQYITIATKVYRPTWSRPR